MATENRPVFVVGHKNPDTDSICSAIAYANLKSHITGKSYEARRAGNLNEETQFVLKKFGVKAPKFLGDVRTQVRDVEIRRLAGAAPETSLKKAWETMKDAGVVTLCITEGKELIGLITISDIVKTYMDMYDADLLSKAETSFANILESMDGTLVAGDANGHLEKGKVVVASGTPEVMEGIIEEGDVVILGNRYEMQLCAIELGASCLITCEGTEVAGTIKKLAESHGCRIICTTHDTFTAARLINQAMPVRHFMMSENMVTFHLDDYVEDISPVMAQMRHRYFPVLDEKNRYVGMISRRNVLGARKKQVILVDHNEKNQAVRGVENADILEIIDHHRLGTVETVNPVFFRNQPLGSSATIIYLMYLENHVKLDPTTAGLMCAAILSDTLMYRSPTCTLLDKQAGADLAEIAGIDVEKFAQEMFRAGSNLGSKSADEIIHQDFKKFTVDNQTIGIGQINSMSVEELAQIKKKVLPALAKSMKADALDMIFFMLTNIIGESSEVIFMGDKAEVILENGFGVMAVDGSVTLPGVVSRKKQLLPTIVETMQM